jgi:hypothetical protein
MRRRNRAHKNYIVRWRRWTGRIYNIFLPDKHLARRGSIKFWKRSHYNATLKP